MLLVVTVLLGGCFGDKTEEKANNESVLAALQQLGQTAKKADATNGVRAGMYLSVGGDFYFYSFEDVALMSADETSTFFNRMNGASMADSYVVNNDKAITFTQVNQAVLEGNSLAAILATDGADVDESFAITPSTQATGGVSGELEQADGQIAADLDINEIAAVENGQITLTMNKTTGVADVTAADFTVTKTVTSPGMLTPAAVTATSVTVDTKTGMEVVLSVDAATSIYEGDQTISYTVAYLTNAALTTADVTVAKKPGTELAQLSVRADSLYVEFEEVQEESVEWDISVNGTDVIADDVKQNDRFYTIYLDESLSNTTGSVIVTGTIGSAGNYIVPKEKTYNFTGTGEYELVIDVKNPTSYTEDEEPAIQGGGAETVQIQAYFIDSGSQSINTAVSGSVSFTMSVAGELSQENITFDDGIAITTLSSEAVTEDTRAQINAVADVTGSTYANLDGASTTAPIWFLAPTGEGSEKTTINYATYKIDAADAYQADRLYVTFSAPLVKRDATGNETDEYIDFESVVLSGITVEETYPDDRAVGDVVDILDVVRIGNATYLFILDTDTDRRAASILKDNSAYKVSVNEIDNGTAGNGNYVIEEGSTSFRFTDITALQYLSANMVKLDGTDSAKEFQLVFNEAVAYDWNNSGDATTITPKTSSNGSGKWFINTVSNITINGNELNITPDDKYEVEAIEIGKWDKANAKSAAELTTAAEIEALDNRNIVTVTLADKAAQYIFDLVGKTVSTGTISVSVANARDWAIYDKANTVAQQVKTVNYDIEMAGVVIEDVIVDSTEQFLVKFKDPVVLADNANDKLQDVLTMYYGVDKAGSGDEDEQEYTMDLADVKITVLDTENGKSTGFEPAATGQDGKIQYVLFELNKDWNENDNIIPENVLYSNNKYKNIQFRVSEEAMKISGQFWENTTEINSDIKTMMLDNSSPHIRHLDSEVENDSTISNEYYIDSDKAPSQDALDTYVVQLAAEANAVVEGVDNVENRSGVEFGDFTYGAAYDKQDIVLMTFNEPIQVLDGTGAELSDPITYALDDLNTETEYQADVDGTLVRVPAKYVAVNERDTTVVAVPDFDQLTGSYAGTTKLQDIKVGDWSFVIKNIDDDAGHNLNSDIQVIDIKQDSGEQVDPEQPDDALATGVYVAWARYIDQEEANSNGGNNYFDNNTLLAGQDTAKISVIEVKFSTEMKAGIPEGVNEASNYFVNGKALPETNTIIAKGIYGVTDSWDGVTIIINNNAIAQPWLDANEDGHINEYIQMNFSKEMMGAATNKSLSTSEIDLRMNYDAGTTDPTDEVTDDNVAEWVCKKLRDEGEKVDDGATNLGELFNNYVAYTTEDLETEGLTTVVTEMAENGIITQITLPTYDFVGSVGSGNLGGLADADAEDHLYTIELWNKAKTDMVTQLSGAELVAGGTDHSVAIDPTASDDFLDFRLSGTNSRLRVYFDDCLIYNMDIDTFYDAEVLGAEAFDTDEDGDIETYKVYYSSDIDEDTVVAGDFDTTVGGTAATAAEVDGSVITLTVEGAETGTAVTRDIKYGTGTLADIYGRALATNTAGTPYDLASPVITAVTVSTGGTLATGDTIIVEFSEDICAATVDTTTGQAYDELTDFTLTIPTADEIVGTTFDPSVVGTDVTLTVNATTAGTAFKTDGTNKIAVKSGALTDAVGNEALTATADIN